MGGEKGKQERKRLQQKKLPGNSEKNSRGSKKRKGEKACWRTANSDVSFLFVCVLFCFVFFCFFLFFAHATHSVVCGWCCLRLCDALCRVTRKYTRTGCLFMWRRGGRQVHRNWHSSRERFGDPSARSKRRLQWRTQAVQQEDSNITRLLRATPDPLVRPFGVRWLVSISGCEGDNGKASSAFSSFASMFCHSSLLCVCVSLLMMCVCVCVCVCFGGR
jgi:hypothetical protein